MPTTLKNFQKAEPANISKKNIEKIAEDIFQTLELKPGFDIEQVTKTNFGGQIEYVLPEKIFDEESGCLEVTGANDFLIRVNALEGQLRSRFTIAHELGHYVLHSRFGENNIRVGRTGENERVEWEANWFAAAFLMPREIFKKAYEVASREIDDLVLLFKVSPSAVNIRISNVCQKEQTN